MSLAEYQTVCQIGLLIHFGIWLVSVSNFLSASLIGQCPAKEIDCSAFCGMDYLYCNKRVHWSSDKGKLQEM